MLTIITIICLVIFFGIGLILDGLEITFGDIIRGIITLDVLGFVDGTRSRLASTIHLNAHLW